MSASKGNLHQYAYTSPFSSSLASKRQTNSRRQQGNKRPVRTILSRKRTPGVSNSYTSPPTITKMDRYQQAKLAPTSQTKSIKLGPSFIPPHTRTLPALSVGICAFAAEESVLRMLDHVEPRVWLRMFRPLGCIISMAVGGWGKGEVPGCGCDTTMHHERSSQACGCWVGTCLRPGSSRGRHGFRPHP